MSHLESFQAIRYRGIDGVSLDPIVAVNLITGPNGAGKTSVAEAIWLFNGRFAPSLPWNALLQRSQRSVVDPLAGLSSDTVELAGTERGQRHEWKAVFERIPTVGSSTTDIGQRATAVVKPSAGNEARWPVAPRGRLRVWLDGDEANGENSLLGEVPGEGIFILPAIHRPADHQFAVLHLPPSSMDPDEGTIKRFSALVAAGHKNHLKHTLHRILPLLTDAEVITDHNGRPFILATTSENQRLPLQALGGGLTRLFGILVTFYDIEGGLLAIDEIEHGLHHLVLPNLWRQVQTMTAERDAQVFATTHSQECLDAALDAFAGESDRLAVHVLSRHDDGVRAVTYSGRTLEAAREINLDLR